MVNSPHDLLITSSFQEFFLRSFPENFPGRSGLRLESALTTAVRFPRCSHLRLEGGMDFFPDTKSRAAAETDTPGHSTAKKQVHFGYERKKCCLHEAESTIPQDRSSRS